MSGIGRSPFCGNTITPSRTTYYDAFNDAVAYEYAISKSCIEGNKGPKIGVYKPKDTINSKY